MGTMFLVVRVVDAFVDPCIGALWIARKPVMGRFRHGCYGSPFLLA
ncbi:hypothetical protein ABFY58_23830 [Enterobacter soli]